MEPRDVLPSGIRNAYAFQALNAMSYNIALGTPLILFARALGASAGIMGLLAGLTPLLSVLQLTAVPYAERVGWRRLMLQGWGGRVAMLAALTVLPLVERFMPDALAITLIVLIMFGFNFLRGFAAGAWLPIITAIVPRSIRGAYLGRDRLSGGIATVVALAASGALLTLQLGMLGFALTFGLSFVTGVLSLTFLNRVPYTAPDLSHAQTEVRIAWRELLRDRDFGRLVLFGVVVQVIFAANGTFSVLFAREELRVADSALVWVSAFASIAGMVALAIIRSRLDIQGSKPFLRLAFGWWLVYFASWIGMAWFGTPSVAWLAILLFVTHGFFAAVYDLSATRLLMNTGGDRPSSARYLTLQSVAVSLAAGISPTLWGGALDLLKGLPINRFGVFFACQLALVCVAGLMLRRVRERDDPA